MFRHLLLISTFFVAACQSVIPIPSKPPPTVSGVVICEETRVDRTAHAASLAKTQDAGVLMTGVPLIEKIDAMCNV